MIILLKKYKITKDCLMIKKKNKVMIKNIWIA